MKTKRTYSAKTVDIKRKWYVIDAEGKMLGRLASKAALLLIGKGKPFYTPHVDCGDNIVIINAEKINVTGNKLKNKMYYHHTGYTGHLKSVTMEKLLQEKPEKVIISAIHGMVPKNRLGRQIMGKLKVYRGSEHPHAAQKPEIIE